MIEPGSETRTFLNSNTHILLHFTNSESTSISFYSALFTTSFYLFSPPKTLFKHHLSDWFLFFSLVQYLHTLKFCFLFLKFSLLLFGQANILIQLSWTLSITVQASAKDIFPKGKLHCIKIWAARIHCHLKLTHRDLPGYSQKLTVQLLIYALCSIKIYIPQKKDTLWLTSVLFILYTIPFIPWSSHLE